MAPVKKKVLRFKNTPIKKAAPSKKIAVKKKEVSLSLPDTEMIAQNIINIQEEPTPTPITIPEKIVPKTTSVERTSYHSFVATPSSDTFLISAFHKKTDLKDLFPRISRIITEKWFLFGIVCGILLVGIITITGNIQANIQEKKILEQKRLTIKQQITYWQENARKYPGYRDAYFQLAILEYQLGDAQASQSYLNKVEAIDPNFQEAYKLEKVLKGN